MCLPVAQAIPRHSDGPSCYGQTVQLMSDAVCGAAAVAHVVLAALLDMCSSAILFSPHTGSALVAAGWLCGCCYVCTGTGRHELVG